MPERDDDGGVSERLEDSVGGSTRDGGVAHALKSKELLTSVALSAAGAIAASKGPDLVRRLSGATEEKGREGAEKLGKSAAQGAGKALSKALGGGSGGTKKTRRLPIQRWTDVAVPVDRAYDAWTKFDEFPKFMHRVLNVDQRDRDRVSWQEKIWFSTRRWEGRITERRKNDRIAWKTTSGMSHKGVVSFHPLADNLTRVMVTMEFEPNGMVEKMASGLRFVKRAVQADLARFKAFVEMEDAKGIEYRPTSGDDGGNDADEQMSRGKDDGERESQRRERETRRKERRQSGAAR